MLIASLRQSAFIDGQSCPFRACEAGEESKGGHPALVPGSRKHMINQYQSHVFRGRYVMIRVTV